MRFVRFTIMKDPFKNARLGVELEGGVLDLRSAYEKWLIENKSVTKDAAQNLASIIFPSNIVGFLNHGDVSINAVHDIFENSRNIEDYLFLKEEVKLLSPIVNPPHLRDFISFEEHIKNSRKRRNLEIPPKWYEVPAYYKGGTSTIIGHDDDVKWPQYTEILDYELEFACIIGKGGKNISKENAEDHIFGYTILNDFSARDIQMDEMSIGLGPAKGKDFATSLGPAIVTKDEIKNPYNLSMKAYVNGEKWSDGSTSTMYRSFPELIEYVSQHETLLPGDILGSGTVGLGCGLELGKSLKPNDVVVLEVEGIGQLRNKVIK